MATHRRTQEMIVPLTFLDTSMVYNYVMTAVMDALPKFDPGRIIPAR